MNSNVTGDLVLRFDVAAETAGECVYAWVVWIGTQNYDPFFFAWATHEGKLLHTGYATGIPLAHAHAGPVDSRPTVSGAESTLYAALGSEAFGKYDGTSSMRFEFGRTEHFLVIPDIVQSPTSDPPLVVQLLCSETVQLVSWTESDEVVFFGSHHGQGGTGVHVALGPSVNIADRVDLVTSKGRVDFVFDGGFYLFDGGLVQANVLTTPNGTISWSTVDRVTSDAMHRWHSGGSGAWSFEYTQFSPVLGTLLGIIVATDGPESAALAADSHTRTT